MFKTQSVTEDRTTSRLGARRRVRYQGHRRPRHSQGKLTRRVGLVTLSALVTTLLLSSTAGASHQIITGYHDHDANTIYSIEGELSSDKKTNIVTAADEWSAETVIDFDRVSDTFNVNDQTTWQSKNLIWMGHIPDAWGGACADGAAIACTALHPDASNHILGPDIVVDHNHGWDFDSTCDTTDDQIDFWTISAHELGHFGGLGHAHPNSPPTDEDSSVMLSGAYVPVPEDYCRRHSTVWDNNRMNENHPHY